MLDSKDVVSKKTRKKFKKIYKKHKKKSNKSFQIMVKGNNDYWFKQQVVGISINNFLIFSGWFISGVFDVKNYMTISEFNCSNERPTSKYCNNTQVDNTADYSGIKC